MTTSHLVDHAYQAMSAALVDSQDAAKPAIVDFRALAVAAVNAITAPAPHLSRDELVTIAAGDLDMAHMLAPNRSPRAAAAVVIDALHHAGALPIGDCHQACCTPPDGTSCAQCGGALGESPSPYYCSERCQRIWTALRVGATPNLLDLGPGLPPGSRP